ncbi:MAG: PaaI family thioesterase, partial [Caldilineaceae bacterium]
MAGEYMNEEAAIQDQIGGNHCWGCGPLNPQGLQIKSYWQGPLDGQPVATCTFQPQQQHMAGPTHVVNGGILATVIDCHCVCTAIAAAYAAEGRAIGDISGGAPELWYATGSLNLTYLRPTPIDQPSHLEARVVAVEGKRTTVVCTLTAGGKECVRAELVAVRVPAA